MGKPNVASKKPRENTECSLLLLREGGRVPQKRILNDTRQLKGKIPSYDELQLSQVYLGFHLRSRGKISSKRLAHRQKEKKRLSNGLRCLIGHIATFMHAARATWSILFSFLFRRQRQ